MAEVVLLVAQGARVESALPQGSASGAVLQDRLDHFILYAISGIAYPSLSLKLKYMFCPLSSNRIGF